ncbi:MAG: ABC transporter substrate-binding protein, partial [Candidatus Nanoarchaeia archaeon]
MRFYKTRETERLNLRTCFAFSVLSCFVAIILLGCLVSVKDPVLSAKFAKPALRVGTAPDFPPIVFKEDKKIKGIESDLAKRVGEILGTEIVFVEKEWEELIPSLLKGDFDVIMSGMTITEERKKIVLFTSPYKRVGQMAIMRTSDIAEFSTVEKVLGTTRRVGYLQGTTSETFVFGNCIQAHKIPLKTMEDATSALLNNNIDVFISDAPVIWAISSSDLTPLCVPLTEEYLAWAVNKNNNELAEILNACIEKMKNDGYL